MDDGFMKSKTSKGTLLNTQGFSKIEVEYLVKLLNEKFNLNTKIRKQKVGFQIYILGESHELLKSLIYNFLLESMRYKFPLQRK